MKEYGATPLESDGTCAFPVHVRWNFVFEVDYAQQVTSSKFPSHPGSSLALLFFCLRLAGGHVVCDSEYVAFEGWEEGLESHQDPAKVPQSRLQETKEQQQQEAWQHMKKDLLVEWDFKLEEAALSTKGGGSPQNPLQSQSFTAEEEEDVEVVSRLFSQLQKMAEAADLEGTPLAQDFVVSLLHGPNTKRKTGRIADAYQGRARRDVVQTWCVHRSLQTTKRFGLLEWTEEGSLTMCQEWCQRIQFFWTFCVEQGDPDLVFD